MNLANPEFINALIIFIIALLAMFYFAYQDNKSLNAGNHTDLKAVIVSIGVLGTFIGIMLGLWDFDTKNIDDSVPKLLEGLKLAFATSIAGMVISIGLTSIQKNKILGGNDELSVLSEINAKLAMLQNLEKVNDNFTGLRLEIRDEQKQTRAKIEEGFTNSVQTLISMESKLDGMATEDSINKFRVDVHEEQLKSRTFLEEQFVKTNQALREAIDVLAAGATEEIINALKEVISDFNNNLVEQFGDNFQELNQAVVALLKWQKEFKEIIEKDYNLLVEVRSSLDNSSTTLEKIADRNEDVIAVYNQLQKLIETYDTQLSSLNQQLETYSKMGTEATKAFESLSNGFEKVQSGIGVQSETIAQLTKDLASSLPESLTLLEDTLVSLTKQFGEDYQGFLDNYKKLLP